MPPLNVADQPAVSNGADIGLDTEEQAVYDAMRSESPPVGDAGFVAPEDPVGNAPDAPTLPAEGASPDGDAAPAALVADDDDDEPLLPGADGQRQPKRVSWNKFKRAEDDAAAARTALETERTEKQAMAERQVRLDERLRLINEALTPPAVAAPNDDDPEPDPEADIFGHNAWLKRQLVKTQQTFDERIGQIETTRQAETSEQRLASDYMDDAHRFAQGEPNFGPAYVYLMQVRTAQLASFHFGKDLTDPATAPLTPQELGKIKSEVAREEKALVSNALKAGKSPAAAVFAMARMTGYRSQAAAPATGASVSTNGVVAPAAAAAPTAPNGAPKPSVRAEIDKIKSGQDASLSLSRGGGSPSPVLNAQKLADMPEEEFGALLESMSHGELRRIMGG